MLCRAYRIMGYDFSYRSVRRKIRKLDRAMRDFPTNVRRCLHKGIKQCDYGVARAVAHIAERSIVFGQARRDPIGIVRTCDEPKLDGLRTHIICIDEHMGFVTVKKEASDE